MAAIARLVSRSKPYLVPGKLLVTEHWFEVPLDYTKPDSQKIKLFAKSAIRYEKPIVKPLPDAKPEQRPLLAFFQGGPGFGNPSPQDSPLSTYMLDRGYELLLLDYRGVGYSSPISANTLEKVGGPQEQADYLKLFRADNIVRDSEAVRKCLTQDYPPEKQQWSIFGQSFGGMTALTYLSFSPEGLREAFITGGLAPLDKSPDEWYQRTYQRVLERNHAYYKKFPDDVAVIKQIASKIHELGGKDGVPLPAGGKLTVPRLLTLGHNFGADFGLDKVHDIMVKLKGDLDQFGMFTRMILNTLEQDVNWDVVPIYSVLHEPCVIAYTGVAANWAAERVGRSLDQFQWLQQNWAGPQSLGEDEPLFFSGEMIYPFFFDCCDELVKLKETAQIISKFDQWPPLYDEAQLKKNDVPVYAAIYNDMYVDAGYARETAAKIKGIKTWESNVHFHVAVRQKPQDVFRELLKLRDDTID